MKENNILDEPINIQKIIEKEIPDLTEMLLDDIAEAITGRHFQYNEKKYECHSVKVLNQTKLVIKTFSTPVVCYLSEAQLKIKVFNPPPPVPTIVFKNKSNISDTKKNSNKFDTDEKGNYIGKVVIRKEREKYTYEQLLAIINKPELKSWGKLAKELNRTNGQTVYQKLLLIKEKAKTGNKTLLEVIQSTKEYEFYLNNTLNGKNTGTLVGKNISDSEKSNSQSPTESGKKTTIRFTKPDAATKARIEANTKEWMSKLDSDPIQPKQKIEESNTKIESENICTDNAELQQESKTKVDENNILNTLEDKEIFVDALLNPPVANDKLKNAQIKHSNFIGLPKVKVNIGLLGSDLIETKPLHSSGVLQETFIDKKYSSIAELEDDGLMKMESPEIESDSKNYGIDAIEELKKRNLYENNEPLVKSFNDNNKVDLTDVMFTGKKKFIHNIELAPQTHTGNDDTVFNISNPNRIEELLKEIVPIDPNTISPSINSFIEKLKSERERLITVLDSVDILLEFYTNK